jgi:hypothetical protein
MSHTHPSGEDAVAVHSAIHEHLTSQLSNLEPISKMDRETILNFPTGAWNAVTWLAYEGTKVCICTRFGVNETSPFMESMFVFIGRSERFMPANSRFGEYPDCAAKIIRLVTDPPASSKYIIESGKLILKKEGGGASNVTEIEAISGYYNKLAMHIVADGDESSNVFSIDSAKTMLRQKVQTIMRFSPILKALHQVKPGSGRLIFTVDDPVFHISYLQCNKGDIRIYAERIRGFSETGFLTTMNRTFWVGLETEGTIMVQGGYYDIPPGANQPPKQIIKNTVHLETNKLEEELTKFIDTVLAITFYHSMLEEIENRIDIMIKSQLPTI